VSCDDPALSTSSPVKDEEVLQDSLAYAARLGAARSGGSPETTTHPATVAAGRPTDGATVETCGLCDADGVARALDGGDEIMLSFDVLEERFAEKPFHCLHSRQENVDALRRARSGGWTANTTGYTEIDSSDDDDDIGETCPGSGIIGAARSRESYSALGNSE
jgi:hypothetical protein